MPQPALSQSSTLRRAAFTVLYASQGMPYGLLVVALPAWLAHAGLTPAQSGAFIGTIMFPWSLKLINGPLMDRLVYPPMGRRRPWIIAAQAAMVLSLLALAAIPDPLSALATLTAAGFCLNLSTVFQDVAVDSLAIDLVPPEEQGVVNGFMAGGRAIGLAGATAAAGWGLAQHGLAATALGFAAAQAAVLLFSVALRERPGERRFPWSPGNAAEALSGASGVGFVEIGRQLLQVLPRPASARTSAAIFGFATAKGIITALLPIMVAQELGWAEGRYTQLMASTGLASGLVGLALIGPLVDRIGRREMLGGGFALLGLGTLAAGGLPGLWASGWLLPAFIGLFLMAKVVVSIAFFATAMALCDTRIAATQYAVYMAISNLGVSAGAMVYGALGEPWGSAALLVGAGVVLVLSALSVAGIDLARHQAQLALKEGP